jgi:hypothetical protein
VVVNARLAKVASSGGCHATTDHKSAKTPRDCSLAIRSSCITFEASPRRKLLVFYVAYVWLLTLRLSWEFLERFGLADAASFRS